MATATPAADGLVPPDHSAAFRFRRFLNWFPMGLTYAFLYMGRYNLTVSKNALGDLMTKEDFGVIFGAGTVVYALAFLLNGPLTDRFGGKKALMTGAIGAGIVNLLLGFYLDHAVASGASGSTLRLMFSLLYGANMYFQSFGAVAIVKVNAHWFHVRERGGFSGIFGTMISSGVFFAFTVNGWLLDLFTKNLSGLEKTLQTKWVFLVPGVLLLAMSVVELFLLRDRPSQAGHQDFDTGDATSEDGKELSSFDLIVGVFKHPIIRVVAAIEFCTGVLRNGVMHWYPIYVKEVLALPGNHPLNNGEWGSWTTIVPFFVVAAILFVLGARIPSARGRLVSIGGAFFLVPFLQAGWGGILMVAGIVGGNVAGFVSDLFFGSRRAPAAGGLYAALFVCAALMGLTMGQSTSTLADSKVPELKAGDRITEVAGVKVSDWVSARRAFACVEAACAASSRWDAERCSCVSDESAKAPVPRAEEPTIAVSVERDGAPVSLKVKDPAFKKASEGFVPKMRAGDSRDLKAAPSLTVSPYLLGVLVFLVSVCVIGTHGLLSGTATMDFGGKKGAATAVAMIDGCVYLGTALQSFALGKITSTNWAWWPWFLVPFALLGFLFSLKIWNAKPSRAGGGH